MKVGFKLDQRRSRYQNPTIVTNTIFADDLVLIIKGFQVQCPVYLKILRFKEDSVTTQK